MSKAHEYNRKRARKRITQGVEFIRLAQRTIGADVCDGEWREPDVELLKAFQRDECKLKGEDVDGMCGPTTERFIRHKSGIMKGVAIEFWWDHGPIERVGALKAAGVDGLSIMCNRSDKQGSKLPTWRREESITDVAAAAKKRNMKVILTVWSRPDKWYIDAVLSRLAELVKKTSADAIEFDLEGNWKDDDIRPGVGFDPLDAAGHYLAKQIRKFRCRHGVAVELTTYPGHNQWQPDAIVAEECDALYYQIYTPAQTKRQRKEGEGKRRIWGGRDAPAVRQRREIKKLRKAWPNKPPVCGLSCWGRTHPNVGPLDSLEVSLCEAALQGIKRVRYWSAKHCTDGEVTEFLTRVKQGL